MPGYEDEDINRFSNLHKCIFKFLNKYFIYKDINFFKQQLGHVHV